MKSFLYHYIRSMRLYYGFVTATTAMFGILVAHCISDEEFRIGEADIIALIIAFLAWGVNQIISDYFDRKEDAINAPHRPMVTGALKPKPALYLSVALLALIGFVSLWVSPWAFGFAFLGGILNIAYSWLKRIPILNCVVYACAISCCALFGYSFISAHYPLEDNMSFGFVLFLFPVHFLMCHNSYYKDIEGDRAAGVRTLQTLFPRAVSLSLSVIVCLAYSVFILFAEYVCVTDTSQQIEPLNHILAIHFFQFILVMYLMVFFVKNIIGKKFHRATCINCQCCIAMLFSILIIQPDMYLWFAIAEIIILIIIQLLFLFVYRDEKE